MDEPAERFSSWFKQHGKIHNAIGITNFPGMGRGAIALEDIPAETVLFSIPRYLLLNTSTSKLPTLLPDDEWKKLAGWTGLILCMMWEYNRGKDGLWHDYFNVMPEQFDSLMFWEENELKELQGSTIVSKIGKEEAMNDYHQLLKPLVASQPDVFGPLDLYSEEIYNRMGSLILSRSFHVEEGAEEDEQEEEDQEEPPGSTSVTMDGPNGHEADESHEGEEEVLEDNDDDDDDDQEDVAHVSMVPWADMLNARHGCDNARLFYEKECLNMTTTRNIKKGEQIWNVYGDPPNSDLLRRYGHVDEHNPSDTVEVTADLVADIACLSNKDEKVEFLLDADLDDTYTFTLSDNEEEFSSFLQSIHVFAADKDAFAKMQRKGKISGKKQLKDNLEILTLAYKTLKRRLADYPWNFEDDERQLRAATDLAIRKRASMIVRHGEMRILRHLISELEPKLPKPKVASPSKSAGDSMDISMEDASTSAIIENSIETAPEGRQRILSKKEMREEKKRLREDEKLLHGADATKKRRRG